MTAQPSPRLDTQRDFDDFDEFTQVLDGWDLSFRQLEPGPFRGRLEQTSSGRLLLARMQTNRTLEQRGRPTPRAWTFGLPLPGCPSFVWRGEQISAGDITVHRPEMEMDAVTRGGFSVVSIVIDEEWMGEIAEELRTPLVGLLERGELLRGLGGNMGPLTRLLEVLFRHGGAREVECPLGLEVVRELVACLGHQDESPGPRTPLRLRQEVFDRARANIVSVGVEPVTVEELCRMTGTNQRTLHRAFQEACGVSPKAFLKAYRLNGVRSLLKRGRPRSVTVGAAANRWGFWHMGDFASDYRRLFGELPSKTLQSSASIR